MKGAGRQGVNEEKVVYGLGRGKRDEFLGFEDTSGLMI